MSIKKVLTPEVFAKLANPPKRMSFSEIAKMYKVSRQRIYQIYNEYKSQYPDLFYEPPKPNREQIEEFLCNNWSLSQIAAYYEITPGTLKKYMEKYNIRKQFLKEILTRDLLYHLYVELEKDDIEIAEMFNCSPNTVMKLRYINGIYENMRKPLSEKLTREIFIELYLKKRLLLSQIADLFNTNIQNVIQLKKEYRICELTDAILKVTGKMKYRSPGVTEYELKKIKHSLIERGVISDDSKTINIRDIIGCRNVALSDCV